MSEQRSFRKWVPPSLGVVCVILVVRLISEINAPAARASRVATPEMAASEASPEPGKKPVGSAMALLERDPGVHLEELKGTENRPLPEIPRNPFDYAPPPPLRTGPGSGPGGGPPPPPPPPPPPIPLKALGYSEDKAGIREVFLSDEDGDMYTVRQGEEVSKRYKILEITPAMVVVVDANSGERATLPIPQEQ